MTNESEFPEFDQGEDDEPDWQPVPENEETVPTLADAHMNRQHVVDLKGRLYPVWAGVLDMATQAGLQSLKTRIVQIPTAENGHLAVVMARAEFKDGRVFEDVGDCSPQSTTPQLATAALRLASTRSKGRVLRDAMNVGEELADMADAPAPARGQQPRQDRVPAHPERPQVIRPQNGGSAADSACEEPGCGVILAPAVIVYSTRKFGRKLCLNHQRTANAPS